MASVFTAAANEVLRGLGAFLSKPAVSKPTQAEVMKTADLDETYTFTCGGCLYVAARQRATTIEIDSSRSNHVTLTEDYFVPMTLLNLGELDKVESKWLKDEVTRLSSSDDVFNEGFLRQIIIHSEHPGKVQVTPGAGELLNSWSASINVTHLECSAPAAPYFRIGTSIRRVYKLYEDHLGAFMFGVLGGEDGLDNFREFQHSHIPVPSRLYFQSPSPLRPLEGMRVALKDVYDLKGTATSASCKAFRDFRGNATVNAAMVQKLLDLGAVIVGKTKTAQFASGEHAGDWIDYACPFNPRGDGYLEPDGSSTGSAAAVAGYGWLDFSIGSDTLGSILCPATSQGIFGIRPTHGLADLRGVIPVSSLLDTAGFFARSSKAFGIIGRAWYGDTILGTMSNFPSRILYASKEFEDFSAEYRQLMDSFVHDLENSIKVEREEFDISEVWNKHKSSDIEPIETYLGTTLAHIQLFDSYHNNLKFRQEYAAQHKHEPYINPMVRFKWDLGSKLTQIDYDRACEQRKTYQKFLTQHVFDKSTILVLPGGSPEVRYRDVYDKPPNESGYSLQGFGFLRDVYSFLGGLPQMVVPVGQIDYRSPVTKSIIQIPVSITLVAAPGMDCEIMKLVQSVIKSSGRPDAVLTGAEAFSISHSR